MHRQATPAAGLKPPALWGTKARLQELFGAAAEIQTETRHFVFRYKSADHFMEVFRNYYGPIHKAFLALDAAGQ